MEGLNLVSTRRLGDNLVLLSPLVGEDLKNMIDGAKEWLTEIFEYIVPWSLEQATGNQKVRIHVVGILLHIWNPQCFKNMVEIMGEMLSVDEDTLNMTNLEYARVLIHTFFTKIFAQPDV